MMETVTIAAAGASLFAAASGLTERVIMDWSVVGNADNEADPTTGFGAVSYQYRIGTYEVTNAQYAAFLNAVAADGDPNELYDPVMGGVTLGGITRSSQAGKYTYSVKANMGNKPVLWVSWYDAARMCNWMTNGQGSGGTESGVYTLTGQSSISAITRDMDNPNQVFIPTEEEWYKAAYHQPESQGGDADNYWLYATRSNAIPTIAIATSIGDVANPSQATVNYGTHAMGAAWNGLDYNVTSVGSAGSKTFYDAFDMNGNVWEWNETLIGSIRGTRGGGYAHDWVLLWSTDQRNFFSSDSGFKDVGFRLASPMPSCSTADLAAPFGTLDIDDIFAFLNAYATAQFPADLAPPAGTFNIDDVLAFLSAFATGCP